MQPTFRKVSRVSLLLFLGVAAFLTSFNCQAQYGAGDMFGVPRFIVMDQGQVTAATSAVTVSNSNPVIDVHGYDGIAAVVFSGITTNASANSTLYARLEGSQTGTNGWALLTNCAVMVLSTNNITNLTTAVVGTNTYLLPALPTFPTTATAGFAGPYLSPPAFTSTSVLCSNVTTAVSVLGFPVADVPRYLHAVYIVTGETNATSCFFIGRKNSGSFY